MEKEMKIAVLIDAENISGKYVNVILGEANKLGNVIYKRIYGDWTSSQMGTWKNVILDNAIQPIQQYKNVSGKNSSDSSLIIDAMDLLYQGKADGFCIVSSDSDFTRLASRLREAEKFVLGMGEKKTPRSFISACRQDAVKKAPREVVENGSNLQSVCAALEELVEENSDDEGWIYSGKLGYLLGKRFPDFDVRNFGARKFTVFVRELGLFEVRELLDDESETSKRIYFRLK